MKWKIMSETWGWLEASHVEISAPLVILFSVTREGKPFHHECMIPVDDAKLIVPPEA